MCCRVNMWGSKFGKELWESLTVATRRDTIQQVKTSRIMMLNMVIAMVIMVNVSLANQLLQFNKMFKIHSDYVVIFVTKM